MIIFFTCRTPSISHNREMLFSDCNQDCSCSSDEWDPVCSSNGITYVSPCMAGCLSSSGFGKNTVRPLCCELTILCQSGNCSSSSTSTSSRFQSKNINININISNNYIANSRTPTSISSGKVQQLSVSGQNKTIFYTSLPIQFSTSSTYL